MKGRRILYLGFAIVAATVSIGCAALWWRSYYALDVLSYQRTYPNSSMHQLRAWFLGSSRGMFLISHVVQHLAYERFARDGLLLTSQPPALLGPTADQAYVSFLGFGYAWPSFTDEQSTLYLPHWFLTLAPALASAGFFWSYRRAVLREREGCCSKCGYDLRATPQRCPECGAVPVKIVSSR